jgi:1-acyl-sn-glycerol-3-phosphate acyltransferase
MPLEDPVLRFSAAEETMRMNPLTAIMKLGGAVTLKRRYRSGGQPVDRPPDLEGIARVKDAIRNGWLLHFPAGTTREGAELRPGVARILHDTKAIAVPVRVDGFRRLLLLRQVPGKLFRSCSVTLHPPMDLGAFYDAPFSDESAARVLDQLDALIHPKA